MSDAGTHPRAFGRSALREMHARCGRPERRGILFGRIVLPVAISLSLACDGPQTPIRMYVLDGGTLGNPDPAWISLTLAEVNGYTSFPVPAYLIVHPDGAVLWDTGIGDQLMGLSPDETQRGPFRQVVTSTIRDQLAEVGFSPSDITYLILSHTHFDHSGNANDYAGATWIVQRAELDWIEERDAWGAIGQLRDSEKIVVDGDHDVFGDGRVVIKSTPGHTPGHQSLFVDLPNTGPIVLSGDLYVFEAHRTLNRVREFDYDTIQATASRTSSESFLAERGAELWIQHDLMQWARLEHAPAYYD